MRKTQEKLIRKAQEKGLSKTKIQYLSDEAKSMNFLNNVKYLLYHWTDEELGDYSIVDDIQNMNWNFYRTSYISGADIRRLLQQNAGELPHPVKRCGFD